MMVIAVLMAVTVYAYRLSKKFTVETVKQEIHDDFHRLQRSYLIVYCLASFSDWLQGPYVYKLYVHYGYHGKDIALLFIAGTISNSLFGTIAGALADKYGRKTMGVLYGVAYSGCCLTNMYGNFYVLLVGRILGGKGTSLLYSAFDSWYINEHVNHFKLPNDYLSMTFAKATFYNAMLAVLAGLLSYSLVQTSGFGPIAPFVIAIPFLITTSAYVLTLSEHWVRDSKTSASGSVKKSVVLWLTDKNIFMLSLGQSLFEGVIYLFIFIWSPALEPLGAPDGLVFASFMLAMMIGSTIYSILLGSDRLDSKQLLLLSTFLGVLSFSVCCLVKSEWFVDYLPSSICYFCFVLFEIAIGIYTPSLSYLKSQVMPEDIRATLSNVIKIPSSIFICLVLYGVNLNENIQKTKLDIVYPTYFVCLITTIFTFICFYLFTKFYSKTDKDVIERTETENNVYICYKKINYFINNIP